MNLNNGQKRIAAKIATQFKKSGGVIALFGDLGSGKTTFTQGFAKGLGITEKIISPTFILMRKYPHFYHVDLYRFEDNIAQEVENIGLTDILGKGKNIVVIEWAEKIKDLIPANAVWIKFENLGKDKRRIIIE